MSVVLVTKMEKKSMQKTVSLVNGMFLNCVFWEEFIVSVHSTDVHTYKTPTCTMQKTQSYPIGDFPFPRLIFEGNISYQAITPSLQPQLSLFLPLCIDLSPCLSLSHCEKFLHFHFVLTRFKKITVEKAR